MFRQNKFIAFMVTLVMVLSILVSPFSAVHANAPMKKPPAETAPDAKTRVISDPNQMITRPITKVNPETASTAKGVSYKLRDGVERLPSNIDYNLEQIKLDEFASYDSDTSDQTIDINNVKGIRHTPGSKFMVSKESTNSPMLQKNKIYIDEVEGLAYRVLENGETNPDGDRQYVVDNPDLSEIFESYKIPAQDIRLTTGNIAYMAPGAELDPASGMMKNYYAGIGDEFSYISSIKHESNKHIINFKANKVLFQYPSKEDREKAEKEKEKADKEKFKTDWWDKEKGKDLKGFDNTNQNTIEVVIKKGQVIIEDPVFHADFDFHWTSWMKADFYFESKTKAEITFLGDIAIDKGMEACIFGYDIDLGSIAGEGKGNRAFVGIFLVVGANGKVHVEVKTTTTGSARAGFEYKALGFGLLPYKVGPYCRYRPTGFDAEFQIDGEIHLIIACVPQVGVIIWGHDIVALQIWAGLSADAKFGVKGGGGSTTDSSAGAHASFESNGFAKLIGVLFDKQYEIFKLDFPIYKGEWVTGEKIGGTGGDGIVTTRVVPHFLINADAYYDTIEGQILYGEDKLPFANRDYNIEIWNTSLKELKITIPGHTDAEGKFIINSNGYSYNILPTDRIIIDIEQFEVYIDDSAKNYFKVDDKVYELTEIRSKDVNAGVPFTKIDFNVDAVNDIITGTVTGKYGLFSGPVDIKIVNKDFSEKSYKTAAVEGIFTLKAPIDENTMSVWVEVNCDGLKFPDNQGVSRPPNIDALEIFLYNDYTEVESAGNNNVTDVELRMPNISNSGLKLPNKSLDLKALNIDKDDEGNEVVRPIRVFGTITNNGEMGPAAVQGEDYVRNAKLSNIPVEPYTGDVKITSLPITSAMLDIINKKDRSNLTDPIAHTSGWTATAQAKQIVMEGIATSASLFEFANPEVLAYEIEIEYEGYYKTIRYNPFVFHYENTLQDINNFANRPIQKNITIITDNKKDAISNPGDMMNPGNIMDKIGQSNKMLQSIIATPENNIEQKNTNAQGSGTTNQWQGTWMTNVGLMELTQKGTTITGTITKGNTVYMLDGDVSNGAFKGSYLAPSATSLFGDIVTFEMDLSTDGKSINFKNFESGANLMGLKGTKATGK